MATTRTLRSYGPDTIYLEGLTKGPDAGWAWDGANLTHPLGIRLTPNADAAARITATINAYTGTETLTGAQINNLPDAQRDEWREGIKHLADNPTRSHNGYRYGGGVIDSICVYTRTPEATTCTFDTAEIIAASRTR